MKGQSLTVCSRILQKGIKAYVALMMASFIVAQSANIEVDSRVDRNTITVGDVFNLILDIQYPESLIVQIPTAPDNFSGFELRDHEIRPPELSPVGGLKSRAVFSLTAFKTGTLEIPALEISFSSQDGNQESVFETDPISITVESVVDEQTGELKDIKPPMEIPRDWLPIVSAIVLILAAATAFFWFLRRRKPSAEFKDKPVSVRPAHELAYEQLSALRASGMLDRGEVKRFHTEVSEIIRRYFEGRFRFDALESTSEEILHQLLLCDLPEDFVTDCCSFFQQCDLVKFAKHNPQRRESEHVLELAFHFVKTSRPVQHSIAGQSETLEDSPEELQLKEGG